MTQNKKFSEFNSITKSERNTNNISLVGFKVNPLSNENIRITIKDLLVDILENNSLGISLIRLKTPEGDIILKNFQNGSTIKFDELPNGNIKAEVDHVPADKIEGYIQINQGGLGEIDTTYYDTYGYFLPVIKGNETIIYKLSNDFNINSSGELEISLSIPLNSKGQLLTRNNSSLQALNPGSNGQILCVDSTTPTGLKWIDLPDLFKVKSYSGGNVGYLSDVLTTSSPIHKNNISGNINISFNPGEVNISSLNNDLDLLLEDFESNWVNLNVKQSFNWGFYDVLSSYLQPHQLPKFKISFRKIIFEGYLILPIDDGYGNISNNLSYYIESNVPYVDQYIEITSQNEYIYKNILPSGIKNILNGFKIQVKNPIFAYRFIRDSGGNIFKVTTVIPETIFFEENGELNIKMHSIINFERYDLFNIINNNTERSYSLFRFLSNNSRSSDGLISTAFNTSGSPSNPSNIISILQSDLSSNGTFYHPYNLCDVDNWGGLFINLNGIELHIDKSISLKDIKNSINSMI